jgi:Protein of unknown function (DUF3073)
MGRGRAKAKQTKVARELKYFSPETDLDRLRAELAGTTSAGNGHQPKADVDSAVRDSSLEDDSLEDDSLEDSFADDEDDGFARR